MQRDGALHEHRSTSEGALFEQCQSYNGFSHSADGRRQEGRTVRCGLPSSKFCGGRLIFLYSVGIFDLSAYRSFQFPLSYQSFVYPLRYFLDNYHHVSSSSGNSTPGQTNQCLIFISILRSRCRRLRQHSTLPRNCTRRLGNLSQSSVSRIQCRIQLGTCISIARKCYTHFFLA
jgi:hypothetical protein